MVNHGDIQSIFCEFNRNALGYSQSCLTTNAMTTKQPDNREYECALNKDHLSSHQSSYCPIGGWVIEKYTIFGERYRTLPNKLLNNKNLYFGDFGRQNAHVMSL